MSRFDLGAAWNENKKNENLNAFSSGDSFKINITNVSKIKEHRLTILDINCEKFFYVGNEFEYLCKAKKPLALMSAEI